MAVFQLPFAIKMDTQIGVSTVCHIPQQEYYNESKIFIFKKMYCTGQNYSVHPILNEGKYQIRRHCL